MTKPQSIGISYRHTLDAMKLALDALEHEAQVGGDDAYRVERDALRAAIDQANDWDEVEALRASLREHMAEIHRLRAVIEQPEPNARALHKMMIAMMQVHWRRIDPQWKDDPELCHALGYEAGFNDAVAQRVEPRESGGSGAGFESLPASPNQPEKNHD